MQAVALHFKDFSLNFMEFKKVMSFSLALNKSIILCILILESKPECTSPAHISTIFFTEKGPLFLKKKLQLTLNLIL